MKRIGFYAVLLFLSSFLTSCGYNQLVTLEEDTNEGWANVEDAYKRRADLVPNLQAIVQGSADFEKETLESVIEARAKATSTTVNPGTATPEQMREYMAAQNQFGSALSRLMLVVERYPDLKSTAAFQDFQHQYEGTENRISKARTDFNQTVRNYNTYRRQFPRVIWAGLFGFEPKNYFIADEEDLETPEIKFNSNNDSGDGDA